MQYHVNAANPTDTIRVPLLFIFYLFYNFECKMAVLCIVSVWCPTVVAVALPADGAPANVLLSAAGALAVDATTAVVAH